MTAFLAVETGPSILRSNDIALTVDGQVHLSHANSTSIFPNIDGGLIDRVFRGAADGGFDVEVAIDMDQGAGVADRARMVAGGGLLHALARSSSSNAFRLLYAQRTDAGWQPPEEVSPGVRIGNFAYDLAVAADGTVHVAFQYTNAALDAGQSTAALAHAQRTGPGQWTVTQIAQSSQPVAANRTLARALSMALLPSGEPVIAYESDTVLGTDGGTNAGYAVATRTGGLGGTFTSETVVQPMLRVTAIAPISLGIAGTGAMYLAYRAQGGTMGAVDNGLRMKYRAAGATAWVDGPLVGPGWPNNELNPLFGATNPFMRRAPDGSVWLAHDSIEALYRLDGANIQRLLLPSPIPLPFGASFFSWPAFTFSPDGKLHFAGRYRYTDGSVTRLYYVRFD